MAVAVYVPASLNVASVPSAFLNVTFKDNSILLTPLAFAEILEVKSFPVYTRSPPVVLQITSTFFGVIPKLLLLFKLRR